MTHALCTVPAAPVRKEPAHRCEMSNQLLFGEAVKVLEEKGEWLRVQSLYDAYEGWITHHLVTTVNKEIAIAPIECFASGLLNPVSCNGVLMNVPMGSHLAGFDVENLQLWNGWRYPGSYRNGNEKGSVDLLEAIAVTWLNAPYLWGGKTILGVDCSGFVQTVFKLIGVPLPRDAYQQAVQGVAINNFNEARKGDVAFFKNENGRVTHVGILSGEGKIIHSSGKVRIDDLDSEGIVNSENGIRTHYFHSVRRCF